MIRLRFVETGEIRFANFAMRRGSTFQDIRKRVSERERERETLRYRLIHTGIYILMTEDPHITLGIYIIARKDSQIITGI